mgnify:FL=1
MSKLFTIKQTAQILGFSTNTIYKFANEGTIKGSRSGKQGRFRIPQSAIEDYLGSKLPAKEDLTPTPQPITVAYSTRPPLALTAIRILLLIALILLIADIFINKSTPFITQVFRLSVIGVFILLAYQFGGTRTR